MSSVKPPTKYELAHCYLCRTLFCSVVTVSSGLSSSLIASPWLETSDPFLRSSLVLLSDAGQISAPINQYPLRWSLIGDDLNNTETESLDDYVQLARNELRYTLNSAKLNRGNKSLVMQFATDSFPASGYGELSGDKWGVSTSVDYLASSFAYRLSLAYRDHNNEEEIDWTDSYLSLNAGQWLFTVGELDYWWGQGWQHNLILASYSKATPSLNANYISHNKMLGVWSFQALMSEPEDAAYDNHGAVRMVAKPWRHVEIGATYQNWFSGSEEEDDSQLAFDAKLTLPHVDNLYHSVYTELASTVDMAALGAWMVGWTGSMNVKDNTVRLVLETQQHTNDYDTTDWKAGSYPSTSDSVANTSYLLDDSYAIAFYVQRMNDHSIGVSYQSSKLDGESINTTKFMYRMPALSGMLQLDVIAQNDASTSNEQHRISEWRAGYELRF
ncbi:capsule assembly Wzi family protein [Marinomonas sp. TW1]|uniref:capsule assembly Wzi family protein n=1 Tax=Marinomonas sp. TW1 TaxID=1561203 RepID=UPI0007AFB3F4|nr:capsule assembly Wzi family protein [Marinomonas sp. TW1]KZN15078.1 hypothetical protein OA79_02440 [Marinomonas sp. TW1]